MSAKVMSQVFCVLSIAALAGAASGNLPMSSAWAAMIIWAVWSAASEIIREGKA